MTDETLRTHYIWQHSINENDYFFKDLFSSDNNLKSCDKCMMEFKNCRVKKKHVFVLRRGPVKYFSINYNQHKNFYDFFQESVVDDFCRQFILILPLVTNIKFRVMLK